VLGSGHAHRDGALPPYTEFAKLERLAGTSERQRIDESLRLARVHFGRRPTSDPFRPFGERVVRDLSRLSAADMSLYHAYVFATLRQCGAAFELAGLCLRWLEARGVADLGEAASAFTRIAQSAQVLVLKSARAVRSRGFGTLEADFAAMSSDWEIGMSSLEDRLRP
jgi:hypothetical protein